MSTANALGEVLVVCKEDLGKDSMMVYSVAPWKPNSYWQMCIPWALSDGTESFKEIAEAGRSNRNFRQCSFLELHGNRVFGQDDLAFLFDTDTQAGKDMRRIFNWMHGQETA